MSTYTNRVLGVSAWIAAVVSAPAAFAQALVGTASGSANTAVTGTGTNGATGVQGNSIGGYGTVGLTNTGVGVFGISQGTEGQGYGVLGGCTSCTGVKGQSIAGTGVKGTSDTGVAVYGESDNNNAVLGVCHATSGGSGVSGIADKDSNVMYGVSGTGTIGQANGVSGTAAAGIGVKASSSSGTGLSATSFSGNAIYATSSLTDAIVGVAGTHSGSAGVWGKTNGSGTYGVYSSGDLYVRGWAGTPGDAYKPGGGSWKATSDARVKRDVKPYTSSLAELEAVHPVRFKYNGLGGTEDTGKEYVGVIAQDLEKIQPFMVTSQQRKLHESDAHTTDIKQVDPSAFTYTLINAVNDLSKQNRQLSERLHALAKLVCADHPTDKACASDPVLAHR